MRDVADLQVDQNFTRVLTDMIGASVFWEGRLYVFPLLLLFSASFPLPVRFLPFQLSTDVACFPQPSSDTTALRDGCDGARVARQPSFFEVQKEKNSCTLSRSLAMSRAPSAPVHSVTIPSLRAKRTRAGACKPSNSPLLPLASSLAFSHSSPRPFRSCACQLRSP